MNSVTCITAYQRMMRTHAMTTLSQFHLLHAKQKSSQQWGAFQGAARSPHSDVTAQWCELLRKCIISSSKEMREKSWRNSAALLQDRSIQMPTQKHSSLPKGDTREFIYPGAKFEWTWPDLGHLKLHYSNLEAVSWHFYGDRIRKVIHWGTHKTH